MVDYNDLDEAYPLPKEEEIRRLKADIKKLPGPIADIFLRLLDEIIGEERDEHECHCPWCKEEYEK